MKTNGTCYFDYVGGPCLELDTTLHLVVPSGGIICKMVSLSRGNKNPKKKKTQ